MSSEGTSSVGSKELFKKLDREVGARIRRRRLELGLSQREVAERTGFCSYQQLQKYELGDNRITISSLLVIARVLNTSVETLIGDVSRKFDGDEPLFVDPESIRLLRTWQHIPSAAVRRQLLELIEALAVSS